MSSYPALDRLRIGCVQYLNARPLIDRYPGPVSFEHPSTLARDIAACQLDAALVPVFEALRSNDYLLVDGAAIAGDGPVYSVFLAYQGALGGIRTVSLDPASLTSVHLLQVLLAEFHGLRPRFVPDQEPATLADARLLIGNQAIAFREQAPAGTQFLDLSAEWKRCTNLPFVFALWLLRADLAEPSSVAKEFRVLKCEGLSHLDDIVASEHLHSATFARKYLTEYIRFNFGDREKAGLQLFRTLLHKYDFISEDQTPLRFV